VSSAPHAHAAEPPHFACLGFPSRTPTITCFGEERSSEWGKISGDIIPFFLRKRFSVDFPVFNVQIPRNENRSHRLITTLRAMVEIAGDQSARTTNDEAVVTKST
jgi:hypothetical protein